MVSPALAAATAGAIWLNAQPLGQTDSVAAVACPAPTDASVITRRPTKSSRFISLPSFAALVDAAIVSWSVLGADADCLDDAVVGERRALEEAPTSLPSAMRRAHAAQKAHDPALIPFA